MLFEALMEKVMHNKDREEAAKAYANSVFFPPWMHPPQPKETQTRAEFSKTCYEWNAPEDGRTVERDLSKLKSLVILINQMGSLLLPQMT